jgi:hypothetical protein
VATLSAGLSLVLAACGTVSMTAPPATPTDFAGITGRLNAAQIKVRNWVSGDAGCQNPDLVKSAISFDASGLDQAEPVRIYLYIFRDRAAFERHRDQIGACAESWVTDPQSYEEIEQSPYIIAGQGPWGTAFEAAFRTTLEEAAGTGD